MQVSWNADRLHASSLGTGDADIGVDVRRISVLTVLLRGCGCRPCWIPLQTDRGAVPCRVDYIETTPHVSRLHHFRIVSFMGILLVSIPLTASLWKCRRQTHCFSMFAA